MKKGLAVAVVALLAYLFFWPVPYDPQPWAPVPPVRLLPNQLLGTAKVLHPELPGPEALLFDADGALITGLRDGRLVRIVGEKVETLATTKRVLGLRRAPDGRLWLCDSSQGLMVLQADGGVEQVATPAKLADDLDFGDDGSVYFSDASARNDLDHFVEDLIEHHTSGRLWRYEPATKQSTVIADGFAFTNGVTFGPSRDWLVVAETGTYRLWKVQVPDGRREIFADALPGFPDNVTWSPERQVFWVAVGSPRDPAIDALAGMPFLRKAIFRLPKAVQPAPKRHAMVLAYDATGRLVETLEYEGADAYSPIASVLERDGALYLGSFLRDGYAVFPLPAKK